VHNVLSLGGLDFYIAQNMTVTVRSSLMSKWSEVFTKPYTHHVPKGNILISIYLSMGHIQSGTKTKNFPCSAGADSEVSSIHWLWLCQLWIPKCSRGLSQPSCHWSIWSDKL